MSIEELRQQASESALEEEEADLTSSSSTRIPYKVRFLGLTPFQTCIVAVLLLLITCLLSTFCLLATGKLAPPIF
jgi:hypothetical protein